jgi:hypothetical protein
VLLAFAGEFITVPWKEAAEMAHDYAARFPHDSLFDLLFPAIALRRKKEVSRPQSLMILMTHEHHAVTPSHSHEKGTPCVSVSVVLCVVFLAPTRAKIRFASRGR